MAERILEFFNAECTEIINLFIADKQLLIMMKFLAKCRGGPRIPRRGTPTYKFFQISEKLHKIKKFLVRRGWALGTPLDPSLK